MKIASSNVTLEGSSKKTTAYQVTERLEVWRNGKPQAQPAQVAAAAQNTASQNPTEDYQVDLDDSDTAAKQQLKSAIQQMAKPRAFSVRNDFTIPDIRTLKMRLLEMMYYLMTGKRTKLSEIDKWNNNKQNNQTNSINNIMEGYAVSGGGGRSGGFGLEFDYHEVRIEGEQVNFRANGAVQTEDGQNISFDIEMIMSRFEYEEKGFSLRLGEAARTNVCDPLVINYAGGAPELSRDRYDFDLTMDGNAESISFAVNGSGFLALDKNGDSIINDGGELFGPQSGNGFMELAAYDLDGNNWIDENDAVFSQLRVLTLDENGQHMLFTLAELGIGAIYLNNVETQYDMKNGQDTQGVMRSSSVFLKENGEAGTINHIDLTI